MAETIFRDPSLWPAPAKLNLFLHITGRRADGYHELQTVFQFLDICDELQFTVRADGRIRRLGEVPGVAEADDLVVRAARLLQAEGNTPQGADIRLDKKLPLGGGLGGGSSDAATTLIALNRLWQLGLDEDCLAALGLQLGADVPVFVRGHAAWAEGVGERLQPVALYEPWFVVLVPTVRVATADLFGAAQLTRDCPPIKMGDYLAGDGGDFETANGFGNVFEPLVRAKYHDIDAAFTWLDRFAPARLTGTGACVFAAFDTRAQAQDVAAQVVGRWDVLVAAGRNRSPLHRVLENQVQEVTN